MAESESVDGDFHDGAFRTVGIVGLGLIGGSLALAIRARDPRVRIVGVDRPAVIDEARRRGMVDDAASDASALRSSELGAIDLIVLAAPVLQNLACLQQLVGESALLAEMGHGETRRGPLVTDVGSTKRVMVEAARTYLGSGPLGSAPLGSAPSGAFTFIGGHPMAGAAQGGLEFARADLFDGRPWLLTPADTAPAADLDRLTALVAGFGALPRVISAAEHDRLMAYISHLPQMISSALMRTVGERAGDDGLQLSGPGLADTTRLASSPAAVWTDICETNADLIDAALDAVQAEIHLARQRLRQPADLTAWLAEGARWRARMPPR